MLDLAFQSISEYQIPTCLSYTPPTLFEVASYESPLCDFTSKITKPKWRISGNTTRSYETRVALVKNYSHPIWRNSKWLENVLRSQSKVIFYLLLQAYWLKITLQVNWNVSEYFISLFCFFFTLQEVTQKFHGKRKIKTKLARINVWIDITNLSFNWRTKPQTGEVGINIQDCSCNNSFSVRGKIKEKSHLTLFFTFHDLQYWHGSILNSLWHSVGYVKFGWILSSSFWVYCKLTNISFYYIRWKNSQNKLLYFD